MVEEIQKWLSSGQDYRSGVLLYLQYGKFPMLKNLFQKSENKYNREKLLHELRNLVKDAGIKPEVNLNVEGVKVDLPNVEKKEENRPYSPVRENSQDAELWSLYKDLEIQRNKLSNYYHVLLKSNASKEELANHYQVIEEKSREMVEVWEKIHNTGKTQEAKEDKETLMRWKKRLIDQKYKENKKLKDLINYPEGSSKRKLIEQEIAMLEVKTEELMDKIKKLK